MINPIMECSSYKDFRVFKRPKESIGLRGDSICMMKLRNNSRIRFCLFLSLVIIMNTLFVPKHAFALTQHLNLALAGTAYLQDNSGNTLPPRFDTQLASYIRVKALKPDISGQTPEQMAIKELEVNN